MNNKNYRYGKFVFARNRAKCWDDSRKSKVAVKDLGTLIPKSVVPKVVSYSLEMCKSDRSTLFSLLENVLDEGHYEKCVVMFEGREFKVSDLNTVYELLKQTHTELVHWNHTTTDKRLGINLILWNDEA